MTPFDEPRRHIAAGPESLSSTSVQTAFKTDTKVASDGPFSIASAKTQYDPASLRQAGARFPSRAAILDHSARMTQRVRGTPRLETRQRTLCSEQPDTSLQPQELTRE